MELDYGSVWIGLILLKLKTYCWNHCSKIIFKCVNSTVGPIFNEKVVKKWNLWVHEQYIMYCFRQKSQHLRLLFIEQYMNSNRVLPKRVKKKKKKKNAKRRRSKRGSKHTHSRIYDIGVGKNYLVVSKVSSHPTSIIKHLWLY